MTYNRVLDCSSGPPLAVLGSTRALNRRVFFSVAENIWISGLFRPPSLPSIYVRSSIITRRTSSPRAGPDHNRYPWSFLYCSRHPFSVLVRISACATVRIFFIIRFVPCCVFVSGTAYVSGPLFTVTANAIVQRYTPYVFVMTWPRGVFRVSTFTRSSRKTAFFFYI